MTDSTSSSCSVWKAYKPKGDTLNTKVSNINTFWPNLLLVNKRFKLIYKIRAYGWICDTVTIINWLGWTSDTSIFAHFNNLDMMINLLALLSRWWFMIYVQNVAKYHYSPSSLHAIKQNIRAQSKYLHACSSYQDCAWLIDFGSMSVPSYHICSPW